ncbi:MAG: agmatinase family protein [Polyangiales bacterium]
MAFDPNAASPIDSGVFGLPHTEQDARVVLVPVPFDATTSYGKGAADGPKAIYEASKQVDLFDLDTGRPYEVGITMLDESADVRRWNDAARAEAEKVIAAAGVVAGDAALERALGKVNVISGQVNDWVHAEVGRLLDAGKIAVVVGGDHSAPFGAIRAYAERFPDLGILHFDAHSDLRPAYEGFDFSHASIMENVVRRLPIAKLVQVGIRDLSEEEFSMIAGSKGRIEVHFDIDLKREKRKGTSWDVLAERMIANLPKDVYVSFDVDGLDPTLCPHTGTPVPGGFSFDEATAVLEALVRSGRTIVGFDLNEVAPGPEGDEWDANVGARLLYKLIGWTLVSQKLSRSLR